VGINAQTVTQCTANQCGGTAIIADIASNCSGTCVLSGSIGVQAVTANNCYGSCVLSGQGVHTQIAIGCIGYAGTGGTGISAFIANSCYSSTGDSGITHFYNMP
jgi:hypothetical protein